ARPVPVGGAAEEVDAIRLEDRPVGHAGIELVDETGDVGGRGRVTAVVGGERDVARGRGPGGGDAESGGGGGQRREHGKRRLHRGPGRGQGERLALGPDIGRHLVGPGAPQADQRETEGQQGGDRGHGYGGVPGNPPARRPGHGGPGHGGQGPVS